MARTPDQKRITGRRRAVEVIRVSRVNGRDKTAERVFRSPDEQRSINGNIATMIGAEIVASYEDLDESGGTMDRPGLNAAIADLEAGTISTIITARVDRYTRDVEGALSTLRRIHDLGGELRCGDLADVDFASPTGRYLFTMIAGNAERERAEKRDGLARSTAAATREGIVIAPLLPGYRRDGNRRVEVDPKVAPLIRPLFERRAAGDSWSAIRRWWHEETGEWLKLGRFRKMIESRLYLGELRYGDTISPVAHTALVDGRLWKDAQTVAAARPPRSDTSTALLAGILVCSGCNRPMTVSRGGGSASPLYRCQSRNAGTWTCPAPVTIMQERTDDWVEAQFLAWASESRDRVPDGETTDDLEDDFARADERIAKAEEELARYLDMTVALDPKRARDGAERRQAAIDEAVAERKQLEAERVVAGVRYEVAERWPELTMEQQRKMLRAGIERITVHPALVTDRGGRARRPVADRCDIDWATD